MWWVGVIVPETRCCFLECYHSLSGSEVVDVSQSRSRLCGDPLPCAWRGFFRGCVWGGRRNLIYTYVPVDARLLCHRDERLGRVLGCSRICLRPPAFEGRGSVGVV